MWTVGIPLLTKCFGYFPGRLIGWGSDIPSGIPLQWAQWGRHGAYLRSEFEGEFERLRADVLALSFADDGLGPRRGVDEAARWYSNARVERRHLRPSDVGLRSVGHFGFFRRSSASALWPMAVEFLSAR